MATYEQSGKRWVVRRDDGTLLMGDKGKPRYFNKMEWAEFYADNVTGQENNPRPPSWRDVVREARARSKESSN